MIKHKIGKQFIQDKLYKHSLKEMFKDISKNVNPDLENLLIIEQMIIDNNIHIDYEYEDWIIKMADEEDFIYDNYSYRHPIENQLLHPELIY
jgi:hypothetical protein